MQPPVSRSPDVPRLLASPNYLDFGVFDPTAPKYVAPATSFKITNLGNGVLAGRIVPQVGWLSVDPPTFRCTEGQSSQHHVTLHKDAPRSTRRELHNHKLILLINSNGGSEMLGGSYTAVPGRSQAIAPAWVWFAIPLVIVLLLIAVFGGMANALLRPTPTAADLSLLYTQGAQTIVAQLTRSPAAPPATPTRYRSRTPTNPPTLTPIPPTMTPWPRSQYPNPEIIVREYYAAINARKYDRAWGMLTPHFQQSCCAKFGNNPFVIYSSWWETIEKVEVLSAYLQSWDANPAPVHVALRYYRRTGAKEPLDTFNVFYLVVDETRKTLLIDQVK